MIFYKLAPERLLLFKLGLVKAALVTEERENTRVEILKEIALESVVISKHGTSYFKIFNEARIMY
jgi:hypothetical protein